MTITNVTGKFCYSLDNEDYFGDFSTEGEAHEEARKRANNIYWIAECVNPLDLIKNYIDIADNILDEFNLRLEDEVNCDEPAIMLTKEQKKILNITVFNFLYKNAELNTYSIKNNKQHFIGEEVTWIM